MLPPLLRGIASHRLVTLSAWLTLVAVGHARAEDVYFHRTFADLKIVEGRLLADGEPPDAKRAGDRPDRERFRASMQPYAVIDGPGEVYFGRILNESWGPLLDNVKQDDVLAFRLPERREVTGRLFAPRGDGSGMSSVTFKVAPPPDQADAKSRFAVAKRQHYGRLLARGLPGADWFAHQVREAESLSLATLANPLARRRVLQGESGLEHTFALFSGERAIDENLQLDRPMELATPSAAQESRRQVKTESLAGITVAEIDWTARLNGKAPALDPLAASIPADQHAVFLPGLNAVAALLAEFHGDSVPVIGLARARSDDGQVQRRYERQLGVSIADILRSPVAAAIRSLAVTGSDPYLPSGTDLAILVETEKPGELAAFLNARIDASRGAAPGAVDDGGKVVGLEVAGARIPDRSLSAYVATLGNVVILTNSRAQLERLIRASRDRATALVEQPEYRYFRDRYRRGEDDESALLVLTDATIRRWCGPRWRIGSSRRVRAAAALAELQAASLPRIVGRVDTGEPLRPPAGAIDLGTVRLSARGAWSETYGTLAFQTPILELPLSEVDRTEADAYGRWRDTYQQNWRGVFDPIAARLSVRPGKLSADVTVMPLIARSEYRQFLELVGDARIAADAGDRHPGTLVHAIMAIDAKSKLFGTGSEQIAAMTRVPQQVALGWLGRSAALYLDDDPFWKELASAERPERFLTERIYRLPIGAHLEVTDGVKLALFLSGLRAFVEQSSPNLTTWENREHKGLRYVRVAEAEGARPGFDVSRLAIYYVTTPRSLTISPNEGVIRRFIERQADEAGPAEPPRPWLGHSLAIRASTLGLDVLGRGGRAAYRDVLRLRSWNNLPILNEWKRLFPDRDPVAVHEAAWGTRLVDPAGGQYVWNAQAGSMESTAFGHPGEPKPAQGIADPLARFSAAELGLSFEDGGLRARVAIDVRPKIQTAARGDGRDD